MATGQVNYNRLYTALSMLLPSETNSVFISDYSHRISAGSGNLGDGWGNLRTGGIEK